MSRNYLEYMEESRIRSKSEWMFEKARVYENLKASRNRLERKHIIEHLKNIDRIIARYDKLHQAEYELIEENNRLAELQSRFK